MATFERRGDLQWRAKIRRKGYPVQSRTFNTRAEAERWARLVESEMDRGVFVSRAEAEQTTLAEALDRYEREVLPTKKSVTGTLPHIRALRERLGSYSLAAITSALIAKYRDERLQEVGPQTVKHDLSVLSRLLNVAMREWGIALPGGNPVQQIKMPKLPEGRDRRLRPGEGGALLAALPAPHDALCCFAIETAMRRSEMARMRWEHVDFKKRVLLVPEGKTKTRWVPLSQEAVHILQSLPRRLDGMIWGFRPDSITQAFDRACKAAGLQDLRFHDLRHEATSRLFERGLNLMEVASITGHSTLQMLKRYTHLRAEDLAKKLQYRATASE